VIRFPELKVKRMAADKRKDIDVDSEEYLEVVNTKGEVIGYAPRSEVHGNPSLIHRVVHVLVFNKKGELLLQKRSQNKDVAPGKWDTSVGGHVGIGEDLFSSSRREMHEELGITEHEPEYLYAYTHSNPYESELVTTLLIDAYMKTKSLLTKVRLMK